MTAPGGEISAEFAAALLQLEGEGRPDMVDAILGLIERGELTERMALEAITYAETLATAKCKGEVTDAQAGALARQLAISHQTGRKG